MIVLAERFWPAIAAAALAGVLFAALGGRGRSSPGATRLLQFLALAGLVAGILAVSLQLVPGRPGLWLETAVLVFGAYAFGCGAGAAARWGARQVQERRPSVSQPKDAPRRVAADPSNT